MKISFYINDEDDAHEAANQVLALVDSFKLLTGELQVVRSAVPEPVAPSPTMTSTGGSAEVPAKRRRGRPPGNDSVKSEAGPAAVQGEADGADEAVPAAVQGGANGADEAGPAANQDNPNSAAEPPAVQEHSSETQEDARIHLRTVARKKGVVWLREILAAQNVQRISELSNTQVRDVLYANRI